MRQEIHSAADASIKKKKAKILTLKAEYAAINAAYASINAKNAELVDMLLKQRA